MMRPTLVMLAAGIGSRYGGVKQMEGVGPGGELLLDYALYDARRAGFGKAVFVVSRALEQDFRARFGAGRDGYFTIDYVLQELDALPPGFSAPPDRKKPWGTGHAALAARTAVAEPFAVINADDYYGPDSLRVLAAALGAMRLDSPEFVMVSFELAKTLSEHGMVSRGVCRVENGLLVSITEREKIRRTEGGVVWEAAGGSLEALDAGAPVSMNCWGFSPGAFFPLADREFLAFLRKHGRDPSKEFYLPSIIDRGVAGKEVSVRVLSSGESWFGMTYPQDRAVVRERIRQKIAAGVYPEKLL